MEQTTEATNDMANDWDAVMAATEENDAKEAEARSTIVMHLVSVTLTETQRAERERLYSQTWKELKAAKATRAAEAAKWREDIKELEDQLDTLAEESETGVGKVETECRRVPNFEQNSVEFFRVDTGELVWTEAMKGDERQLTIDDALGASDAAGDAEPEDVLDAAMGDEDVDSENEIDDPEALLEGAAEEEAPKKSRKRKG